jgi:hypothetical protein
VTFILSSVFCSISTRFGPSRLPVAHSGPPMPPDETLTPSMAMSN